MVDVLWELGCLYEVLDVFTGVFLPFFRQAFDGVVKSIESLRVVEQGEGQLWVVWRGS